LANIPWFYQHRSTVVTVLGISQGSWDNKVANLAEITCVLVIGSIINPHLWNLWISCGIHFADSKNAMEHDYINIKK
jgi:hypothetical protein